MKKLFSTLILLALCLVFLVSCEQNSADPTAFELYELAVEALDEDAGIIFSRRSSVTVNDDNNISPPFSSTTNTRVIATQMTNLKYTRVLATIAQRCMFTKIAFFIR